MVAGLLNHGGLLSILRLNKRNSRLKRPSSCITKLIKSNCSVCTWFALSLHLVQNAYSAPNASPFSSGKTSAVGLQLSPAPVSPFSQHAGDRGGLKYQIKPNNHPFSRTYHWLLATSIALNADLLLGRGHWALFAAILCVRLVAGTSAPTVAEAQRTRLQPHPFTPLAPVAVGLRHFKHQLRSSN